MKYLLIMLLMLCFGMALQADSLQEFDNLLNQRKYDEATEKLYAILVKGKNHEAEKRLKYLLEQNGTSWNGFKSAVSEKNLNQLFFLLEERAKEGDALYQYWWGEMLGWADKFVEAENYYQKSFQQGYCHAGYSLLSLYEYNLHDMDKAMDVDPVVACYVKENTVESKSSVSSVLFHKYEYLMYDLHDDRRAVEVLHQAVAADGHGMPFYELGALTCEGYKNLVLKDLRKCAEYMRKADEKMPGNTDLISPYWNRYELWKY